MTREDQLQQHLNMMRGEPVIPLAKMQGITQALRLRNAGLTYGAIAKVMSLYHGCDRTEAAWRHHLREHGASPKHHPNSLRLSPQQREAQS